MTKIDVVDFDFISVARRPTLWPARWAGRIEALRTGREVPFSKTAAWSRGLQRALPLSLLDRPVLFIQSTPALDLPGGVDYSIYTDRLGGEGLTAAGGFSSSATPGWTRREQRFVAGARRLFVMGPSTKHYAVDEYGLDPERVVVVGGAPNAKLGPHRQSSQCERLLFVGIDWRRKGLPDLLVAFAEARETHPELRLDVVGGIPTVPIPDGVEVIGRVPHDQMAEYFARSDLLVIPTYTEPFGIALVEALMMGIPVIGTTVGNQEWIVRDGGVTVAPGDPTALASAIREAVDGYPDLKRRADVRRGELLATMTWDKIADRILSELISESEVTG